MLVTGATGYVATLVLPALRERYALTLVDVTNQDRDGHRVDDVQILDLLDDPDDRLTALCADIDTIVHCGFRRPREPVTYLGERVNVDMTARVLEVAAATDVQRVVSASTNQASKWYERPYKQGLIDRVDPFDYPRPDSFYGWAKVAYESLGFLYACGSISRPVPNVQIRIVCPREIKAADFADRPLTRLPARHRRLHQRPRSSAALRPLHRRRIHRRRLRCPVPDLLRREQQRPDILEHQQRPPGHRLPATR